MDISIIIPYNKDRGYLGRAINSAVEQDFKGYYEIIKEYANHNVSTNINNALKKAKGEYIKLLGEDDLLSPNCLTDLYNKISQGFDLVAGGAINFGPGVHQEYYSTIPQIISQLAADYTLHGGTIMYRREALERIGGFDESLWTAEEAQLHLRMLAAGMSIGIVNKLVYRYRLHPNQNSMQGGYEDGERMKRRHRAKMEVFKPYFSNHNIINTLPQSNP